MCTQMCAQRRGDVSKEGREGTGRCKRGCHFGECPYLWGQRGERIWTKEGRAQMMGSSLTFLETSFPLWAPPKDLEKGGENVRPWRAEEQQDRFAP